MLDPTPKFESDLQTATQRIQPSPSPTECKNAPAYRPSNPSHTILLTAAQTPELYRQQPDEETNVYAASSIDRSKKKTGQSTSSKRALSNRRTFPPGADLVKQLLSRTKEKEKRKKETKKETKKKKEDTRTKITTASRSAHTDTHSHAHTPLLAQRPNTCTGAQIPSPRRTKSKSGLNGRAEQSRTEHKTSRVQGYPSRERTEEKEGSSKVGRVGEAAEFLLHSL